MKMRPIWIAALLLILVPAPGCGPGGKTDVEITTGSLFEEMIDMARLAQFPHPAYKTIQFSSYDRRSRLPGGPEWFANADGFGGEPTPGFEAVLREPGEDGVGEYLMADIEGPGALVRLWTAAIDGSVELRLDDQENPVYRGPAQEFFQQPLDAYPQASDLDRENLERTLYQRDAVYAPMPFARRLRLVWTGDLSHIHFYQLEVRKYAPGTRVSTFSPEDLSTYREIINRVTAALADPDRELPRLSSNDPQPIHLDLNPGESGEALVLEGPAALERLELKLEAERIDLALRQTLLHILCDDFPAGQVQSPVGDFFGAAPGINPFQSLPFTVHPDGTMICRFVMPYQNSMTIRFENMGGQPVSIRGSALPMAAEWKQSTLHFRARWRVDHDLIADPGAVQDLPFLLAQGRGVYVGTTSILLNPNPIPTPHGNWWGEGDEKVFVDEDKIPSIFGTGSEDYYNYSWSSPDIFDFPYCGQPRNDGPGNRGFVTNYRWHILDPLPFNKRIGFYMELYSHERTPGLSYARIGYHYGRPGIIDDATAIKPDDLREQRLPEGWLPEGRFGARNSVFFQTEDVLAGKRLPYRSGRLWAGARLPVWRPGKSGDVLKLEVPVPEDGEYRIHFVACLDASGGAADLRWDGEAALLSTKTSRVDFFRPHRTLLRNFTLESRELKAGLHALEFVYPGAVRDIERPEIGIDFVWVQKIK